MERKEFVKTIKYAIFDMDGTLADSLGFWEAFWPELGKQYMNNPSFRADAEVDRAVRTVTMNASAVMIQKAYLNDVSPEEIYSFCNKMIDYYYNNKVDMKTGVPEFLEYMRSRGVKMCIASATEPRFLHALLKKCALAEYFEDVVSCTDVGAGKEKPDVFLEALRRLGGNIEDACVFEDSFVALETAKKAGFKTVGIYDKNNYGQDRLKAAADVYMGEGDVYYDLF
ncbi:MAG: HAD family phosphatase [Ruminococcaceae bacterium]|nr:HAD family phosphatase [Oscillospiraceae bacterium]